MPEPIPTKTFTVRIGYTETNYVERYVTVEASSQEMAEKLAVERWNTPNDPNITNVSDELLCEPRDIGVAEIV